MLKLTKKGDKYWLFEDSQIGLFSPSKFTINLELNEIVIVYENGLKSKRYNVSDCEIYDLGELTPFTTSSGDLFMQKLEELNCPCFQKNENIFNITGGSWSELTDFDALNDATLPLSGTEEIPIVQGGETKKVAVSEFGGGTPNLQDVTDVGNTTTNQINIEDNSLQVSDTATNNTTNIASNRISQNDLNYATGVNFRTRTQNSEFYFEDEGGTKSIATREWTNANKQDTLVSATNIKTINGNSVLGSGNLVVSASNVVTEINTLGTVNTAVAETITYSLLIPANTISVGVYDCIFRSIRSSGTGSSTLKIYLNSSNSLIGASLVGQVPSTATARYMALQRFVDVKVLDGSGLGTEVANVANSNTLSNDYVQHASVTGMGNIPINWTNDVYLIATLTASVGTDVIRGTFLTLKK